MNLTLILLAQTFLLCLSLFVWSLRINGASLTDAAEWTMALWVGGGPLGLAWVVRAGVYIWKGW